MVSLNAENSGTSSVQHVLSASQHVDRWVRVLVGKGKSPLAALCALLRQGTDWRRAAGFPADLDPVVDVIIQRRIAVLVEAALEQTAAAVLASGDLGTVGRA